MAGAEMFTVLAVIEARDRISETLERAEGMVNRFSGSLQRMAGVAEESGARVDESLLQTASGADALDLAAARVEATQAKAAAATREQAAAEQELLDVQAKMAAGELDAAEAADKQAAALARLQKAQRDAALASKELGAAEKVQADTAAASAAKSDVAAVSQGRFSGVMAKGSSLMAGATKAAAYAGVAVAAIGYESVKAATSFQTLTTQLVTTAGEAPSALKQVQNGILQISTDTATSANDLAKSMYIVEASGYNAAHGGLDVLKAATEGARLENSDFKTVANGVTDILKDYHLGANQAANVTSQLVVAVGHGKANFQQFSAALSNILPMGSAVGLKFNDLAGVLAEMTSHGVTAQRASQNMYNAMRNLEKPTATMTKEFKAVGINAKELDQHLARQGLGGTMQWLSGLAKDNAARLGQTYPAALASLMGSASGLSVALMSTGENAKDVNKAIAAIGKGSADSKGNVQGFAQVQQTLGFKMDQAKQAIHNTGIAIGTALLPMVTKIFGEINKILMPLAEWAQKHQKLVTLIFGGVGAFVALAGAIKLTSIAVAIFNTVMDANPISLIIIAIAALVAAFIYCWDHFKSFRDFWKAAWSDVQAAAEFGWHIIQGAFAEIARIAEEAWSVIKATTTTLWRWFVAYIMAEVHAVEAVLSWFGKLGSMFVGWLASAARSVSSGISSIVRFFENLPHTILSMLSSAGSWLIDTGKNLIIGLWNGIASMGSWLAGQLTSLVKDIVPGPIAKVLGIASPSKWAHWAGQMVGQGLANGIIGSKGSVAAAANKLAGAVTATATGTLSAGLTVAGNAAPVLTGTPGLVGTGVAAGGVTINLDLRGAHVMSDADIKKLADQVGRQIPHSLAAAGVRVRA